MGYAISSGQTILKPWRFFKRSDEVGRIQKAVCLTGVQQCAAAAHHFDCQLAALEVCALNVGGLQFATWRRFQVGRTIYNLGVVEIKPGDPQLLLSMAGFSSIESAVMLPSNSTTRIIPGR